MHVRVRNLKALHRRNTVTMLVGTCLSHPGVIHSFTSQHTDRQEMGSRQSPSSGAGRMQRTRSSSMDITALQSAPLPPSSRRNRTASQATAVYGSGHKRVATKSMSGLSSATGQITPGRQGGRSRLPFALHSLLPNDFRYAVRP
jgi:hypothetical protein